MDADRLNLSGEGPLPSTDEESIFVGEDNAKGKPENADPTDKAEAVVPAPGGGGAYPLPKLPKPSNRG